MEKLIIKNNYSKCTKVFYYNVFQHKDYKMVVIFSLFYFDSIVSGVTDENKIVIWKKLTYFIC